MLFTASSHAEHFTFVALGDTAYDAARDQPIYEALIETINQSKPEFTIHVGDVWGLNHCGNAEIQEVAETFERFDHSLVYVPGDNEWTDCHYRLADGIEWINEKLYHGERTRALRYWPGTILSATGLPCEDEVALLSRFRDSLPSALFQRPFDYSKTGSQATSNQNLLEARNLLAASGWQFDDGALRNARGTPFTLELLALDPANTRILLPWFAALERLGIEARIRLADVTQYTNRIRRREYDALVQDYGILMPPTLELRSHFHSTSTGQEGSRNVTGHSDPVVDYLVESGEAAETLDQIIAACRALNRALLWDHYLIPLYAIDQRRTLHWDKFGRPPEPLYRPAYPDGWWYDESKAARLNMER